jgi:hypothetical protein
VVSISQRSEELRIYNLILNLKILNPDLKGAPLNASFPGRTVRFKGGMIGIFLK